MPTMANDASPTWAAVRATGRPCLRRGRRAECALVRIRDGATACVFRRAPHMRATLAYALVVFSVARLLAVGPCAPAAVLAAQAAIDEMAVVVRAVEPAMGIGYVVR